MLRIAGIFLPMLLSLGLLSSAQAADAAASAAAQAAAPGSAATVESRADDSNAQRAQSQPGNNAPMWRAVRETGEVKGYTNMKAPEAGTLIQSFVQYPGSRYTTAGEAWRQVRNNWIIPYGGSLLLIMLGAVALLYWRAGTIKLHEKPSGRMIERFTPFERSAHMANAAAFTILAISGVVMAFGKFFLLPVIGATLFGWLSYALKTAHNLAGPLFAVSLLIVILTFIRDNLPAKGDLNWLLKGGGMLSGHEVKSGRFNAGEKIVFWGGVFVLGLIVVASGLVMDQLLPGVTYDRRTMQIAHMVHSVSNILMLLMFIGHIYLGVITEGALEGIKTGYVDEAWAKQHHELWYDDVKSGKIPAKRSAESVASKPLQA